MNGVKRLVSLADISGEVSTPKFDPQALGCGIVHIGAGAFHRAHQAVYTDDALAEAGGDWRIRGVSLRGTDVADALNPQNGLYTVVERGPENTKGRVIGSISGVIAAARDRKPPIEAMADPATRIITLTVTEKAYGIDRAAMTVDASHPAVAADLAEPRRPVGVLGLIAEALRLRRESGTAPFTVLCCDNLPDNGALTRTGVIDFAKRVNSDLAAWIEGEVAFPSSMVDRITPATTQATLDDARRLTGCIDFGAVETEPFSQWVIEDRFTTGRPEWEAGGALFVGDVKPYELMKLRMLNGAHSMLAYTGFHCGHRYVRDVMADESLRMLAERHIKAAAATLPRLAGIDLEQYRRDLQGRFSNPAIAHETYQIAMDGTEKLPQRILAPAQEALAGGDDIGPFAFAIAAWMCYCLGTDPAGTEYALRDPREDEIRSALRNASTAHAISEGLHGLPGLFDTDLTTNREWRKAVERILSQILENGMVEAARNFGRGQHRCEAW